MIKLFAICIFLFVAIPKETHGKYDIFKKYPIEELYCKNDLVAVFDVIRIIENCVHDIRVLYSPKKNYLVFTNTRILQIEPISDKCILNLNVGEKYVYFGDQRQLSNGKLSALRNDTTIMKFSKLTSDDKFILLHRSNCEKYGNQLFYKNYPLTAKDLRCKYEIKIHFIVENIVADCVYDIIAVRVFGSALDAEMLKRLYIQQTNGKCLIQSIQPGVYFYFGYDWQIHDEHVMAYNNEFSIVKPNSEFLLEYDLSKKKNCEISTSSINIKKLYCTNELVFSFRVVNTAENCVHEIKPITSYKMTDIEFENIKTLVIATENKKCIFNLNLGEYYVYLGSNSQLLNGSLITSDKEFFLDYNDIEFFDDSRIFDDLKIFDELDLIAKYNSCEIPATLITFEELYCKNELIFSFKVENTIQNCVHEIKFLKPLKETDKEFENIQTLVIATENKKCIFNLEVGEDYLYFGNNWQLLNESLTAYNRESFIVELDQRAVDEYNMIIKNNKNREIITKDSINIEELYCKNELVFSFRVVNTTQNCVHGIKSVEPLKITDKNFVKIQTLVMTPECDKCLFKLNVDEDYLYFGEDWQFYGKNLLAIKYHSYITKLDELTAYDFDHSNCSKYK